MVHWDDLLRFYDKNGRDVHGFGKHVLPSTAHSFQLMMKWLPGDPKKSAQPLHQSMQLLLAHLSHLL